jgi:hypothetical protein
MNRIGVLKESPMELKRYARDFLNGAGVDSWSEAYLNIVSDARVK